MTEIVALHRFWPAEDYHQRYFDKHPGHDSCHWIRGLGAGRAGQAQKRSLDSRRTGLNIRRHGNLSLRLPADPAVGSRR